VTRLNKRDVEKLLDHLDDDPIGALTTALQKVLDARAAAWPVLIERLPLSTSERGRLLDQELDAMYDLAALLNEQRTIEGADHRS
jgi:hypothetical protein